MKKKTCKNTSVIAEIPDFSVFDVSADDIRLGEEGDTQYCAIALTVRRKLKGIEGIEIGDIGVDGNSIRAEFSVPINLPVPQMCIGGKLVPCPELLNSDAAGRRNIVVRVPTPKKAQAFIKKFDNDKKSVKPFKFAANARVTHEEAW